MKTEYEIGLEERIYHQNTELFKLNNKLDNTRLTLIPLTILACILFYIFYHYDRIIIDAKSATISAYKETLLIKDSTINSKDSLIRLLSRK